MWGLQHRAVRFGTLATVIASGAFLALTVLVPFETVRTSVFEATGIWLSGGIWFFVRYLGGPIGGMVTGYLTGQTWEESSTNGVRATLLGLLVVYALYGGAIFVNALVQGSYPPLFAVLVVIPLFNGPPFFGTYLIGGIGGGVVGMWLRKLREGTLLA